FDGTNSRRFVNEIPVTHVAADESIIYLTYNLFTGALMKLNSTGAYEASTNLYPRVDKVVVDNDHVFVVQGLGSVSILDKTSLAPVGVIPNSASNVTLREVYGLAVDTTQV